MTVYYVYREINRPIDTNLLEIRFKYNFNKKIKDNMVII